MPAPTARDPVPPETDLVALTRESIRPRGSTSNVQERWAFTTVWRDGMVARATATQDGHTARGAALLAAG